MRIPSQITLNYPLSQARMPHYPYSFDIVSAAHWLHAAIGRSSMPEDLKADCHSRRKLCFASKLTEVCFCECRFCRDCDRTSSPQCLLVMLSKMGRTYRVLCTEFSYPNVSLPKPTYSNIDRLPQLSEHKDANGFFKEHQCRATR